MGALTSLLAGFTQGAGEHIADVTERKRQEDVLNTRTSNNAALDYIKNNPNLSQEEQESLIGNVLKNYGTKPADIQTLIQHARDAKLLNAPKSKDGQTPLTNTPGMTSFDPTKPSGSEQMAGAIPQGPSGQAPAAPQGPSPQGASGLGQMPQAPAIHGQPFVPPYPEAAADPYRAEAYKVKANNQAREEWTKQYGTEAINQGRAEAETTRQLNVESARRKGALDTIDEISKRNSVPGGTKYTYSTTQNGNVDIKPDFGKPSPGFVEGTDIIDKTDKFGKPVDPDKFYRERTFGLAAPEYVAVPDVTKGPVVPDQASPTGFSTPWYSKGGKLIDKSPGATPPASYAEQVTTNSNPMGKSVQTQGPNGPQTTFVPNTTTTTRQRVIPGQTTTPGIPIPQGPNGTPTPGPSVPKASAPKPGVSQVAARGVSFDKPLTPNETMETGMKAQAIGVSVKRAQDIIDNLGVLNNAIAANKIAFVIEPTTGFIHANVARNVQLTPKETEVAADFKQLAEDVNTLRGPMGATGFRGPEAFAALQGLIGSPNGNVDLLRSTLGKTIESMQRIASNYDHYLPKNQQSGVNATPNTPIPSTKKHFSDGSNSWDIPLDKVDKFKQSHPNAREQ